MKRLNAQDLKQHLEQNPNQERLLLDVREPWEFEICHIDGSQLVPIGEITTAIEELDPENETVVICHHGIRSLRVAMFLENQGFSNVINLEGGVQAWADVVDKGMAVY
jgi:rhodanese-related sulfurtransferase